MPAKNDSSLLTSPQALPVAIAFLALLLRLWGIGWGLPNDTRAFSFHPDESLVVSAALRINPFTLQFDPQFYNYGSLSLLLDSFFIHLGEMTGLVRPGPAPGIPSASALLVARLITVCLGAGTCLFLFAIGRLTYGRTAGATAALLYAITPLAMQHGHFATVDVPATFWVTGALYFAVRHLSEERGRRDLLWCGLWSGLAAATKYNASLVLFAGAVAWLLVKPRTPAGLALLLGASAAGFLLGCPGFLLNFPRFQADLAMEANHVREGHGLAFVDTPPGFLYHFTFNLGWGIGWPLVVVSLVALVWTMVRRQRADWVLLAFLLPYYLLIGQPGIAVKFARYTIPMLPPLLLFIGALIPDWKTARIWERGATVAIGAAAAFALLLTVAFGAQLNGEDPRDQAAGFIRESEIGSVGFPSGPWFYSPTLGPLLGHQIPPMAQQSALGVESPRLIPSVLDGRPVEWSVELLRQSAPDAVALSELNEYGDAVRVRNPEAMRYLEAVAAAYPRKTVFAAPLQALGLPITRIDPGKDWPTQNLPHDMLYTNPTVIVRTR